MEVCTSRIQLKFIYEYPQNIRKKTHETKLPRRLGKIETLKHFNNVSWVILGTFIFSTSFITNEQHEAVLVYFSCKLSASALRQFLT